MTATAVQLEGPRNANGLAAGTGASVTMLAADRPVAAAMLAGDGTRGTADYQGLIPVDRAHYIVGSELARGGMGRILRARDRRLGRPVAIKELLVRSEEWRTRFEREARITARLQHPSIVNIVEAGTWPSGEPFYAMKLVAGRSLDQVIAENATVEARLALLPHMIAVVDALAYAHSEGIIHRDLKPANVLVGDFGETIVIDWGLAKALDDVDEGNAGDAGPLRTIAARSSETVDGSVMGTPAYMPLEQALGEPVDATADVYALGAMLYHLLAGAPPYTGSSAAAILAAVAAEPPVPIDTQIADLPRDLVAILDKAMARDKAERYHNAAALADDLKKFPTGQLVGVHRYSTWQLVRRWVRRHRAAVLVAAIALVVLVVFGVVSIRELVEQQAKTEEQRVAADSNRRKAEDLLSFMLVDLRNKLKPVGKLDLLDDVANKAVGYYATRPDDSSDSDEERGRRALAFANLGDVMLAQGNAASALDQFRRGHAIREQLAMRDLASDRRQADLAVSHDKLGQVHARKREFAAALEHYRASLAIRRMLVARAPTPEHRRLPIGSHRLIAQALLKGTGDVKGAVAESRASVAIAEQLAAENLSDNGQRPLVHAELADALLGVGDVAGARASYETSLALTETVVANDPGNADEKRGLGQIRLKLAGIRELQGDASGALDQHRAALAILEPLAQKDPTNGNLSFDLWRAHRAIGTLLTKRLELDTARDHLQACLDIIDKLAAKNPSGYRNDAALTRSDIADVLLQMGDLTTALARARESLALMQKGAADDFNDVRMLALVRGKLGDILLAYGDTAAALAEYRDTVRLAERLVAMDGSNTTSKRTLAASYQRVGDALVERDPSRALEAYRTAGALLGLLATAEPANATLQTSLGDHHRGVGAAQLALRNVAAAVASFRENLAIRSKLAAMDPQRSLQRAVALAHEQLGDALVAAGQRAEARAHFRVAKKLRRA